MTPECRAAAVLSAVHDGAVRRRLAPDVAENLEQAVALAIREAVLAEREGCARAAEYISGCAAVAIAARIRAREGT